MQTLSLVSPLLPLLCLRVKLFIFGGGLQVHFQVIELLASFEILRILLLLLEKMIGAVVSIIHTLFILIFRFCIVLTDVVTGILAVFPILMDSYIVIV